MAMKKAAKQPKLVRINYRIEGKHKAFVKKFAKGLSSKDKKYSESYAARIIIQDAMDGGTY